VCTTSYWKQVEFDFTQLERTAGMANCVNSCFFADGFNQVAA
jgi:hypothetical protein